MWWRQPNGCSHHKQNKTSKTENITWITGALWRHKLRITARSYWRRYCDERRLGIHQSSLNGRSLIVGVSRHVEARATLDAVRCCVADNRIVFCVTRRSGRTAITNSNHGSAFVAGCAVPVWSVRASDCRCWSTWVVFASSSSSSSSSLTATAATAATRPSPARLVVRSVARPPRRPFVNVVGPSPRVSTCWVGIFLDGLGPSSNADSMVPCRQCTRPVGPLAWLPVCASITARRPVCLSTNGRVLDSQVITSAGDLLPRCRCTAISHFFRPNSPPSASTQRL